MCRIPRPRHRRGLNAAMVVLTLLPLPLAPAACVSRGTPGPPIQTTRPAPPSRPVGPTAERLTPSRKDFAKAFARVSQGMPAGEARSLLGPPDDVRTETDPGGIPYTHTREIWGYGTDRHLGFATLGTVAIDDNNRVQYLSGTAGADDLVARLGEGELRRLLRLLARTGGEWLGGNDYNPRYTVAAVNALQPLGKKVGVAVMEEYLRVSFDASWGEDEGLILVMRALFEVPRLDAGRPASRPLTADELLGDPDEQPFVIARPGFLRPPMLGAPDWFPNDPTKFPRFPLVLVDDIPLLPIHGYTLGGHAEPAADHLQHLKREAEWRREPLKPGNDPLGAGAKLFARLASDHQGGDQGPDERTRAMVAGQLLRLIDTAYRPPERDEDADSWRPSDQVMASFADTIEKVRALGIRWDDGLNVYVRGSGDMLPPLETPVYRRSIFRPHFTGDEGYRLKVIVERLNPKRIAVTLEIDVLRGARPDLRLRVLRLGSPDQVLVGKDSEPNGSTTATNGDGSSGSWSSATYRAALAAGERVRVEVTNGDQHFASTPVEP